MAAEYGHLNILKYLLNTNEDINPAAKNNWIFRYTYHIDILQFLIKLPKIYGICPSAKKNTALIHSFNSYRDNRDIKIKFLLDLPNYYNIRLNIHTLKFLFNYTDSFPHHYFLVFFKRHVKVLSELRYRINHVVSKKK
jgi:hypothetical protein